MALLKKIHENMSCGEKIYDKTIARTSRQEVELYETSNNEWNYIPTNRQMYLNMDVSVGLDLLLAIDEHQQPC